MTYGWWGALLGLTAAAGLLLVAARVSAIRRPQLAIRVIPYLRDLWADLPDHWTPQVSQQRVAANAPAPVAVAGD